MEIILINKHYKIVALDGNNPSDLTLYQQAQVLIQPEATAGELEDEHCDLDETSKIMFEKEDYIIFLALDSDNKPVGEAYIDLDGINPTLDGLYVLSNHRCQSIGSLLINARLQYIFQKLESRLICMQIAEENSNMQSLAHKLGFKRLSTKDESNSNLQTWVKDISEMRPNPGAPGSKPSP